MASLRIPDFCIIGAEKAATTFVHVALRSHPEIYMPKHETPYFEDPDYSLTTKAQFERQFDGAPSGALIGIKRPTYLGRPEVAARLAAANPDCRLIAVLRNPISRAVSAHFHLVGLGLLPLEDVNVRINRLLDGNSSSDIEQSILTYGKYGLGISRFLENFPRGQMLIMKQEEFSNSGERAMESVTEFLGLKPLPHDFNFQKKVNSGLSSASLLKVNRAINSVRYSHDATVDRLHRRNGAFGRALDVFASVFTIAANSGLSLFGSQPSSVLQDSTRQRLRSYFQADLDLLSLQTGLDVGEWAGTPTHAQGIVTSGNQ